jgi:hypothetical protein
MADKLTSYLTVNDLRVLKANGLDAPGFFTRHYQDKVVAAIDRLPSTVSLLLAASIALS